MRDRSTRSYRPKGWSHYLDHEPREQHDDADLKRARRRYLRGLDKKMQKAKGRLWDEGNEKHPPRAKLTEAEIAAAVAEKLGMTVDDYLEDVEDIGDMREEDSLANADATTLFLVDLRKHGAPLLTREQEIELARRARAGDERARAQLVGANVRLCVHLARFFRSRGLSRLLDYPDLINAGVVGLRAAVKKFDPDIGVPLASFAYSYITGAIRDELEHAALVRLPREVASQAAKIIRAMDQLSAMLDQKKPTDEEIAKHLGVPTATVSRLLQAIYETSKPLRSPLGSRPVPPTTEAGGGGHARFDTEAADAWDAQGRSHNYSADVDGAAFGQMDDEVTSADDLEASEASALLYKALDTLTKEEREIVSRYFDLVENPEVEEGESLTEIARRLGISKQNASKLKRRALTKLREALDHLAH